MWLVSFLLFVIEDNSFVLFLILSDAGNRVCSLVGVVVGVESVIVLVDRIVVVLGVVVVVRFLPCRADISAFFQPEGFGQQFHVAWVCFPVEACIADPKDPVEDSMLLDMLFSEPESDTFAEFECFSQAGFI